MEAVVVAVISILGTWFVRGWVEEWRDIREALRKERRERYAQVLNPYVQAMAAARDNKRTREAHAVVASAEYRKEVFDLALIAEDEVVRAYRQMMMDFQRLDRADTEEARQSGAREGMRSFARLLLQIRRSLGNRGTSLTEVEILEAMGVTDAGRYLRGEETLPATLEQAIGSGSRQTSPEDRRG